MSSTYQKNILLRQTSSCQFALRTNKEKTLRQSCNTNHRPRSKPPYDLLLTSTILNVMELVLKNKFQHWKERALHKRYWPLELWKKKHHTKLARRMTAVKQRWQRVRTSQHGEVDCLHRANGCNGCSWWKPNIRTVEPSSEISLSVNTT